MAIQYKKGNCTECGSEDVYIVKKIRPDKKFCQRCNQKRLNEKKKKRKADKKADEDYGQLEMFYQIWAERPHICVITGEEIRESPDKSSEFAFQQWLKCFSHRLPKGTYPKRKLSKENIDLMLPEKHDEYHSVGMSILQNDPLYGHKWRELFKRKVEDAANYHREVYG